MRRRILPATVIAALTFALLGAATAPTPHPLPAVTLGSVLLWRVEVAAALFAASYGAIVVVRLALHGETLTRVGRDGIEAPRVGAGRVSESAPDGEAAVSSADLQTLIRLLIGRVATSDDPTDPLLRNDEEQIYHDRDAD